MLFSTPSHFLVLALVAFGFLLIGLASRSGGRKWRELYEEESDDFSGFRADADDKTRAADRRIAELEGQQAEAAATIAGLEARLQGPVPVPAKPLVAKPARALATETPEPAPAMQAAGTPTPEAPLPIAPLTPTPALAPAPIPAMPENAWFQAAGDNDLTRIRGIESVLGTRLFGLGVNRFADIERLSAEDEMALEQRLNLPAGFIARAQWRDQATLLRAGDTAEHQARFGGAANA